MPPLQPIDLGTPYNDPQSPLYSYSIRTSHIPNSTMTHASQLSPTPRDYFTHKPRSFLPSDEKPLSPSSPSPRKPSRLLGYNQPPALLSTTSPPERPRAPLRKTLIRLLVLSSVLVLCALGWRCESVGCKGRGGGGLVGDFDYEGWENEFVGGGSVVAGWGTKEGMDLSRIWDRESWGGEERDEEEEGGLVDEEGELVGGYDEGEGEVKEERGIVDVDVDVDVDVEWDDEAGDFADVVTAQGQGIVAEDVSAAQAESQDEQDLQYDSQTEKPLIANKSKRENPHTAHEAALIDVVAGKGHTPTDKVHIEGEHVLATNTSSVSPQDSYADDNNGNDEEESWTGFLRWWW